jgi:hypothetical protein
MVIAPSGSIQPHSLLLRMPKTASPRPVAGQHRADDVELRRVGQPRRPLHPPPHEQDDHDHDRLAGEDVAPAELGGHPAADERAGRDRGAGDAADDAERHRALVAGVGRRDQRDDRRDDEGRADALDRRPADQQDGQVRAQRGGQGAQA